MSEPAVERPTRAGPPRSAGASGNVFTRKYGPLPGWGWSLLAAAAAGGYLLWRNRQGAAAAQAAQTDTSAAVTDDVSGQLSTIQSEIQALQGEESSEGQTTPANSGTGSGGSSGSGGKGNRPGLIRHSSTGKETLNQIAKANGTSVQGILSISKPLEHADNFARLLAWSHHPGTRRRGVIYYTRNRG